MLIKIIHTVRNPVRWFIQNLGWNIFTAFFVGSIFAGAILASVISSTETKETPLPSNIPLVLVKSVGDLSTGSSIESLVGEVKSVSEAAVFTESNGIIQYVSYQLGDRVLRGAVIAEIENSSERAAVASAEANLAKIEAELTRDTAQVLTNAEDTYRKAFTLASDAVYSKTDSFFSAPRTSDPRLTISQFGATTIESDRAKLNDLLAAWERTLVDGISGDEVLMRLGEARIQLEAVKLYLDKLATIVSRQEPSGSRTQSTIDTEKASVFSARSNIDTALSNVTTSLNTLAETLPQNRGGTGEANALRRVAQANLDSARAALQKTIIRAPIAGTLNTLDLRTGDFVASFTEVARIANNNALSVTTFISSELRNRIAIGNKVLIEDRYDGTISNIAPAVHPVTKKIEVEIQTTATGIANGETVRVDILGNTNSVDKPIEEILVPITALKVETDRIVVFSVSQENTLIAHEVETGAVVGNRIVIETDISTELEIVTDARGLNEGDLVARAT